MPLAVNNRNTIGFRPLSVLCSPTSNIYIYTAMWETGAISCVLNHITFFSIIRRLLKPQLAYHFKWRTAILPLGTGIKAPGCDDRPTSSCKTRRRCELLGGIRPLSPEYLLDLFPSLIVYPIPELTRESRWPAFFAPARSCQPLAVKSYPYLPSCTKLAICDAN